MQEFVQLLSRLSLDGFPAGLGGCAAAGSQLSCCEYDLSVFDERDEPDTIAGAGSRPVRIHHCSLSETRSDRLVQLDGLRIVSDEQWGLHQLLMRLGQRRAEVYDDCMRSCLVDAMFCATKSQKGAGSGDAFAACWSKCAAVYMADAVLLSGMVRPSPAHMLSQIRGLRRASHSRRFSSIAGCTGMERAAPSLLGRMSKSAQGFSDMAEGNGHSAIIAAKAAHLQSASLLPDCYLYLLRVCRDNMVRLRASLQSRPELIHVLGVAMDTGADHAAAAADAARLYDMAGQMLSQAGSKPLK